MMIFSDVGRTWQGIREAERVVIESRLLENGSLIVLSVDTLIIVALLVTLSPNDFCLNFHR